MIHLISPRILIQLPGDNLKMLAELSKAALKMLKMALRPCVQDGLAPLEAATMQSAPKRP